MKATLAVINQMQADGVRHGLLAKWERFGDRFLRNL